METKKTHNWDNDFVRYLEFFIDLLLVAASIFISYSLQLFLVSNFEISTIIEFFTSFNTYYIIPSLIIANIVYILVIGFFFAIYKSTVMNNTYIQAIVSTYLSLFISFLTLILIDYIFNIDRISLMTLGILFAIQILIFTLTKKISHRIYYLHSGKNVLVVGNSSDLSTYIPKLINKLQKNRTIKYIIETNSDDISSIITYLNEVNLVYVLPNLSEKLKNLLVNHCLNAVGIDVNLVPQTYEVGITNAKIETLDDSMVYRIKRLEISITNRFFKRTFDLILSLVGIILALPFYLIIPILIKIYDKGPILYVQERVTRNNKVFNMYKYRTMIVNAESLTGAVWADENDSRITKLGKFLRRFRLDELPQLFNVLRGDMSFVGPRPERKIFIDQFSSSNPHFIYRLNVKAGITGAAQIYGKYNTSPDDKLRFDLYYIRNYTFFLDIKYILLTIKSIFKVDSTEGLNHNKLNIDEILNKNSEIKFIRI